MKTQADGFRRILEVLDLLEIPYEVVGSLASSMHGIPRATMDVDLVADLRAGQIEDFVAALKADFYADAEMIKEALTRGRPFNLIHYASSFKFDIFPLQKDEFSQTQFGRRQFAQTTSLGDPIECAVATAEDTILNKLRWYRTGGETSERQWNDLRGILQVSGARLDLAYLNTWAPRLGVADLLERLLRERTPRH
ncbi:MAG: hypothetical protein ABSE86_17555 [Bryobacteraceae bacterium]|jgi:hypothetical protein